MVYSADCRGDAFEEVSQPCLAIIEVGDECGESVGVISHEKAHLLVQWKVVPVDRVCLGGGPCVVTVEEENRGCCM